MPTRFVWCEDQPTRLCVGKTTSAHMFLFSLWSLSHAYVWAKCIMPTRPLSATYLTVPHAQRDSHHASPRLPWFGPSLMSCHVAELQLQTTVAMVAQLQLSSQVKYQMPYWTTAVVAMYDQIYYSCHDLKILKVATY